MRWRAALIAAACPFLAAGAQSSHVLVVSGLGGEPRYSAEFRQWGLALVDAARSRYALPDSDVVYLAEAGAADPRIAGVSTRENVARTLQRFAQRAGAKDPIVVVLIGHGSGEGEDSRISLPGPDLAARDFARLLAPFRSQPVAFIDMTSASGDMLPVLAAPNRVVITATRSSFERNESVFAGYFVAALTGDGADTDKDGRVSLLEAFQYAAAETARHYEQETRLQTEHAQLDDQGTRDGVAVVDARAAAMGQGQGTLARRLFLGGNGVPRAALNDPRLAALYQERLAIEARIDSLKQHKGTMAPAAYDSALEDLLVQLSLKAKAIKELEGP